MAQTNEREERTKKMKKMRRRHRQKTRKTKTKKTKTTTRTKTTQSLKMPRTSQARQPPVVVPPPRGAQPVSATPPCNRRSGLA
jgi:hypothetical protein